MEKKEKTIYEKLLAVQNELKAPKDKRNNFGGYNYRSCESILEAVKPLLQEQGLMLTIKDEVVNIGDRYYVRATVLLDDISSNGEIAITALAREEEAKKGMDASQITGTASSYARKYALNGLFLIDDTKDADATNTHGNELRNISKLISECNDESALNSLWKKCSESEQVKFREEFSKRKQEILG